MAISVKQYARALFESTKDNEGENLNRVIQSFSNILVRHNQVSKINRIITEFKELWNKENNFASVEIVSARALSGETLDSLKAYAEKKIDCSGVEVKNTIDEKLIGGVVIKYADHLFDSSIRSRIMNLKKIFKNS